MTREKNLTEAKTTKKNLRTMQHSKSHHPIRESGRIVKYGLSGFARNIWLSSAATVVMAITLIILFMTVVTSVVLNDTANQMREKIDFTVYLKPGTSEETLRKLSDIIEADPNVKFVETATSKQEYQKFLEENSDSEELIDVIEDEDMKEIMISKMQATMRIKAYDVDNMESIKNTVKTDPSFTKHLDAKNDDLSEVSQVEIATITRWAKIASIGGIILGVVFLVISVLIIFSTIRMAIFSRREEIYMMKLVGAGKRFIRGPFLIEAEICGMIAGLLAATISYFSFDFLAPRLANYGIDVEMIQNVLKSNQLVIVFLAFVALGIIIGRISSRLAVSKYLHKAA